MGYIPLRNLPETVLPSILTLALIYPKINIYIQYGLYFTLKIDIFNGKNVLKAIIPPIICRFRF